LVLFQTMFHNALQNVTGATRSGRTVETHRQFKADIDHLFAQLLLDNSSRTKRDSIPVPPDLKTRCKDRGSLEFSSRADASLLVPFRAAWTLAIT
jgi:hypothetical protein